MIGFLPPVGLRKGNKVGRIQIHQPLFFVYFCTGFNRLFHRPPQAEGKSGQHKVPYFLTEGFVSLRRTDTASAAENNRPPLVDKGENVR